MVRILFIILSLLMTRAALAETWVCSHGTAGCPAAASLGHNTGPRVLRSSLAEPEDRPARWGASMRPTQVAALLLQVLARRRLVVH